METCLLCERERLGTGFVCTTKEDGGKVCLFHRIGLHAPLPWEKGLQGYRDAHVGVGEESSKWRSVRKT